jgi:hypothetical protein
MVGETYRSEWVKCGNPRCRSCPHGPYWYAYKRDGKKIRKRYVGKVRDDLAPPAPPPAAPDPWDRILCGTTASAALALEILGFATMPGRADLGARWRRLAKERHPDRGGSERRFAQTETAYRYLCRLV